MLGLFEARIEAAKKIVSDRANPKLSMVPMVKCRGKDHLRQMLDDIASKGGELNSLQTSFLHSQEFE